MRIEIHPEGYLVVDGEAARADAMAAAGVSVPSELVGLAVRQLDDGRWAVIDAQGQRGPTDLEQQAIDAVAARAPAALQAELDARESKRLAGAEVAARELAGVEPTDVEVRLRALELRLGAPTEDEKALARADIVAAAAPAEALEKE